jgi:hypothetical protein
MLPLPPTPVACVLVDRSAAGRAGLDRAIEKGWLVMHES